jgi:glycine hydroxymethyltransferase
VTWRQGGYFSAGLESDPELFDLIEGELKRQRNGIELIASENLVSRCVLAAQGSVLTNKTVEGAVFKRYYGGAFYADEIEALAITRACKLFNCRFANVQPHSGTNANAGVLLGLLELGAPILSMNISAGGHISHGHPATLTGRDYAVTHYGVSRQTERIDLDEVRDLAIKTRPHLIIAGGSAYPREIDFYHLRQIADEIGAYLMVDMAHFAGLVASRLYPDPLLYAHVVTTTTYKSLRGARGGMVLWNDADLTQKINQGIFPGVQGSVMLHAVAGKAACFGEALRKEFSLYNNQAQHAAALLAQKLSAGGARIVTGGTDTTLVLVDLTEFNITGDTAAKALDLAGLAVNKNLIPFDQRSPESPSGLRLSTNAGVARGFGVSEFATIGEWITRILHNPGDMLEIKTIAQAVSTLCAAFPIY